jgi:hypothetical protein
MRPTIRPGSKNRALLSEATRRQLAQARPLANYKLNYVNGDYPFLSMLYAIYAGGEHTLYCDHPGEYVQAYLVAPVVEAAKARAAAAVEAVREQGAEAMELIRLKGLEEVSKAEQQAVERMKAIGAKLATLSEKRQGIAEMSVEQQVAVLPSDQHIQDYLEFVMAELKRVNEPYTPPLPMW